MTHDSKRSKNTLLPAVATLLLTLVLAFALGPMTGCSTDSGSQESHESEQQTTASKASRSTAADSSCTNAGTSHSDEAASEKQPFKIDTESYSIELPAEWNKYADVEYDTNGNAQVVYKSNAQVVLLTCAVNDASDEVTEGDIGNGLVQSVKLGSDKRLDVWAPNYAFQFWQEHVSNDGASDYGKLSNAEKKRIIKLTSGKNVNMKKLYKVKSETKVLKKYGTNYEYLGKLVKKGASVK